MFRTVLGNAPKGKRPLGTPRLRYENRIKGDVWKIRPGMNWEEESLLGRENGDEFVGWQCLKGRRHDKIIRCNIFCKSVYCILILFGSIRIKKEKNLNRKV